MFDLKDKVVLITGATGGIGGAIAQQMKSAGATVVVTGRNLEKLNTFDDSFVKIQHILFFYFGQNKKKICIHHLCNKGKFQINLSLFRRQISIILSLFRRQIYMIQSLF